MRSPFVTLFLALAVLLVGPTSSFTPLSPRHPLATVTSPSSPSRRSPGAAAADDDENSGVVELGDAPEEAATATTQDDIPKAVSGPLFISQGEIDPDTLNPDFSDAKQTRVILYTILSLLPVLFLIPFMLGRDFIPTDQLPPVEMNL